MTRGNFEEDGEFRQGMEMKSVLISLRQQLMIEGNKKSPEVSLYLIAAFNYLHIWSGVRPNGIGNMPIVNK